MRILIRNNQRRYTLDLPAIRQLAKALAHLAQTGLGGEPTWQEVTLHLLDDKGITPINQAILAHPGPTDVITQCYAPIPGEPPGLVGELFVNVAQAAQSAVRRAGWSVDRELALYLAHGFDHLTGADDATEPMRQRMRRRELAWLRKVPLTPLFQNANLFRQNR